MIYRKTIDLICCYCY